MGLRGDKERAHHSRLVGLSEGDLLPTAARIAPLPRAGYSLGLRRGRMMRMHMKPAARRVLFCLAAAAVVFCVPVRAQQYDQKLFGEMRWRCIGPFRGGRAVADSGRA